MNVFVCVCVCVCACMYACVCVCVCAVIIKVSASIRAILGIQNQIDSGELVTTMQSHMVRLCIYNHNKYHDVLSRSSLISDYTVVPAARYNSPFNDPVSKDPIVYCETATPELDALRLSELEYSETWWYPLKECVLYAIEQGYLVSFKFFHSMTVEKQTKAVAPMITAITFHTLASVPRHRMPFTLENYTSTEELSRMAPPVAVTIPFQFLDKLFFNLAVNSMREAHRGPISGMLTALPIKKNRAVLNQLLIIEPHSESDAKDSHSSMSHLAALDFVAHRFTAGAHTPVNTISLVDADYAPKSYVAGYLFADNASLDGAPHVHTVLDLCAVLKSLHENTKRDVVFPYPSKFLVIDASGDVHQRPANEYHRYCLCYVIDTNQFMLHQNNLLQTSNTLPPLRQWLQNQSVECYNTYGVMFEGPIESEKKNTEFSCSVTSSGTLLNISRAVVIESNMNFSYFINFSRYNGLAQDTLMHEEWKRFLWIEPGIEGGGYLVVRKIGSPHRLISQAQHQFVYVPPDIFQTNGASLNGWSWYEKFLTNQVLRRYGGAKGVGELNATATWELCGVVAIRNKYGCSVDAHEYGTPFNWHLFFHKTKKVWSEYKWNRNFFLFIPTSAKWHVYRYQTCSEATKWMDEDDKYEAMFALMQQQIEAEIPSDYQQHAAPFVFAKSTTYVRCLAEMKHFDISSDKQLLLGEGFLPYNMPVVHELVFASLGRDSVIHPAMRDKDVKATALVGYDIAACPAHVETLVDDLNYSPLLAEFILRASGLHAEVASPASKQPQIAMVMGRYLQHINTMKADPEALRDRIQICELFYLNPDLSARENQQRFFNYLVTSGGHNESYLVLSNGCDNDLTTRIANTFCLGFVTSSLDSPFQWDALGVQESAHNTHSPLCALHLILDTFMKNAYGEAKTFTLENRMYWFQKNGTRYQISNRLWKKHLVGSQVDKLFLPASSASQQNDYNEYKYFVNPLSDTSQDIFIMIDSLLPTIMVDSATMRQKHLHSRIHQARDPIRNYLVALSMMKTACVRFQNTLAVQNSPQFEMLHILGEPLSFANARVAYKRKIKGATIPLHSLFAAPLLSVQVTPYAYYTAGGADSHRQLEWRACVDHGLVDWWRRNVPQSDDAGVHAQEPWARVNMRGARIVVTDSSIVSSALVEKLYDLILLFLRHQKKENNLDDGGFTILMTRFQNQDNTQERRRSLVKGPPMPINEHYCLDPTALFKRNALSGGEVFKRKGITNDMVSECPFMLVLLEGEVMCSQTSVLATTETADKQNDNVDALLEPKDACAAVVEKPIPRWSEYVAQFNTSYARIAEGRKPLSSIEVLLFWCEQLLPLTFPAVLPNSTTGTNAPYLFSGATYPHASDAVRSDMLCEVVTDESVFMTAVHDMPVGASPIIKLNRQTEVFIPHVHSRVVGQTMPKHKSSSTSAAVTNLFPLRHKTLNVSGHTPKRTVNAGEAPCATLAVFNGTTLMGNDGQTWDSGERALATAAQSQPNLTSDENVPELKAKKKKLSKNMNNDSSASDVPLTVINTCDNKNVAGKTGFVDDQPNPETNPVSVTEMKVAESSLVAFTSCDDNAASSSLHLESHAHSMEPKKRGRPSKAEKAARVALESSEPGDRHSHILHIPLELHNQNPKPSLFAPNKEQLKKAVSNTSMQTFHSSDAAPAAVADRSELVSHNSQARLGTGRISKPSARRLESCEQEKVKTQKRSRAGVGINIDDTSLMSSVDDPGCTQDPAKKEHPRKRSRIHGNQQDRMNCVKMYTESESLETVHAISAAAASASDTAGTVSVAATTAAAAVPLIAPAESFPGCSAAERLDENASPTNYPVCVARTLVTNFYCGSKQGMKMDNKGSVVGILLSNATDSLPPLPSIWKPTSKYTGERVFRSPDQTIPATQHVSMGRAAVELYVASAVNNLYNNALQNEAIPKVIRTAEPASILSLSKLVARYCNVDMVKSEYREANMSLFRILWIRCDKPGHFTFTQSVVESYYTVIVSPDAVAKHFQATSFDDILSSLREDACAYSALYREVNFMQDIYKWCFGGAHSSSLILQQVASRYLYDVSTPGSATIRLGIHLRVAQDIIAARQQDANHCSQRYADMLIEWALWAEAQNQVDKKGTCSKTKRNMQVGSEQDRLKHESAQMCEETIEYVWKHKDWVNQAILQGNTGSLRIDNHQSRQFLKQMDRFLLLMPRETLPFAFPPLK
jgi:hypothetical protein